MQNSNKLFVLNINYSSPLLTEHMCCTPSNRGIELFLFTHGEAHYSNISLALIYTPYASYERNRCLHVNITLLVLSIYIS